MSELEHVSSLDHMGIKETPETQVLTAVEIRHAIASYRKSNSDITIPLNESKGMSSEELTHTINILRQKTVADQDNVMQYAMLAIMIMIPAAIAGVLFVMGTGMVR